MAQMPDQRESLSEDRDILGEIANSANAHHQISVSDEESSRNAPPKRRRRRRRRKRKKKDNEATSDVDKENTKPASGGAGSARASVTAADNVGDASSLAQLAEATDPTDRANLPEPEEANDMAVRVNEPNATIGMEPMPTEHLQQQQQQQEAPHGLFLLRDRPASWLEMADSGPIHFIQFEGRRYWHIATEPEAGNTATVSAVTENASSSSSSATEPEPMAADQEQQPAPQAAGEDEIAAEDGDTASPAAAADVPTRGGDTDVGQERLAAIETESSPAREPGRTDRLSKASGASPDRPVSWLELADSGPITYIDFEGYRFFWDGSAPVPLAEAGNTATVSAVTENASSSSSSATEPEPRAADQEQLPAPQAAGEDEIAAEDGDTASPAAAADVSTRGGDADVGQEPLAAIETEEVLSSRRTRKKKPAPKQYGGKGPKGGKRPGRRRGK